MHFYLIVDLSVIPKMNLNPSQIILNNLDSVAIEIPYFIAILDNLILYLIAQTKGWYP